MHILIAIKGQRHRTLTKVYIEKEHDKLKDWIKKIPSNNKVMEELHEDIQRLRDHTQEKILEVEKYYDAARLEIF